MSWPGGAAYAVTVTIDVDGDLPLLAQSAAHADRAKSRSVGIYGPEHGAPRLLRLFTGLGVSPTWFVPGLVAERYPDLVRRFREAGHPVAAHGHRHLDFDALAAPAQREELLRGRDALVACTGEPVRGFRTPGGEWAPGFLAAMAAEGFRWSSSLPADERPFTLPGTGLTEIPFRYELEDLQYLGYNLDPPFPPGQSRITPLETVEENWRCEAAGAARYGTLLHLRLNAEVMGTPGRARMLGRLLSDLLGRGDAWYATCDQLAEHHEALPADPEHPMALFDRLGVERLPGGAIHAGRTEARA